MPRRLLIKRMTIRSIPIPVLTVLGSILVMTVSIIASHAILFQSTGDYASSAGSFSVPVTSSSELERNDRRRTPTTMVLDDQSIARYQGILDQLTTSPQNIAQQIKYMEKESVLAYWKPTDAWYPATILHQISSSSRYYELQFHDASPNATDTVLRYPCTAIQPENPHSKYNYSVGDLVLAYDEEDHEWYEATITKLKHRGEVSVEFNFESDDDAGTGNKAHLPFHAIQPFPDNTLCSAQTQDDECLEPHDLLAGWASFLEQGDTFDMSEIDQSGYYLTRAIQRVSKLGMVLQKHSYQVLLDELAAKRLALESDGLARKMGEGACLVKNDMVLHKDGMESTKISKKDTIHVPTYLHDTTFNSRNNLVLVISNPADDLWRFAIRQTWGQRVEDFNTSILFVIVSSDERLFEQYIHHESLVYQDLIFVLADAKSKSGTSDWKQRIALSVASELKLDDNFRRLIVVEKDNIYIQLQQVLQETSSSTKCLTFYPRSRTDLNSVKAYPASVVQCMIKDFNFDVDSVDLKRKRSECCQAGQKRVKTWINRCDSTKIHPVQVVYDELDSIAKWMRAHWTATYDNL